MFMPANKYQGFTLIELVVGMVAFSIALVLFTSLIVPQAKKSVDPIFQVRAAELGQSLMNEVLAKSFDEESNRVGGSLRCNDKDDDDNVIQACTTSDKLGDDGESRDNYDDVDDYDGFTAANSDIKNALNEDITLDGSTIYSGFSVSVTVVYDDDMDGIDNLLESGSDDPGNTKLITVTVTTPNDEDIIFSAYRSNF